MVEILRITYYLYEFKKNRRGTAPIYCKLTTDGAERQQFSTGLYVTPDLWFSIVYICISDTTSTSHYIGNARIDSVIYDPAPARTGRRGRPAKHGKQLSVETGFTLSNKKIGDYYTGVRRVLTKIF